MDESAAVPEPSPITEFNLLGPLAVFVDDHEVPLGGRRQVAVLGRLVLSPRGVVSMDELAESVWDGDRPSRPDIAIRSYISNLRRSIEPGRDRGDPRSCLESISPGYRLVVERHQLDSYRFEALLTAGRTALGDGEAARAVRCLTAAEDLWRGEPCEGHLETDALLAFRSRLAELRLATTELRCEATLALGEHESVIADLEAAIAAHPLRERLTELAMLALYRAGRQSDALSACRQLHDRLLHKLGVSPGRPIQELEHRILTHDQTLIAPPRSPSTHHQGPSSRPQLRRSTVEASDMATGVNQSLGHPNNFVGRDAELRSLKVVAESLNLGVGTTVLVTGVHGIGKTSLIERYCGALVGVSALWGRCRSVASDNPLWPWTQILDRLAPLANKNGMEDALTTALATATSSPNPSSAFRPITEVLRQLAESEALVIVLDDAQWADATSLELLSFAATALTDAPVAFIVIWQGSATAAATAPLRALAHAPQATRIELGPIDRSAVEELVEASGIGGRSLTRRIWAETVGHPHFVKELLVPLARGDAPPRSQAQIPSPPSSQPSSQEVMAYGIGDHDPQPLTPTANLRDSVMARVEAVHPTAEAVAAVAAMHRRRFSFEVLTECVDAAPVVVEQALDALVDSGLISEQGAGATFGFVHPIAAKAIASSISRPRQARLHATIGHAMWRHGWPNLDLAYHFSQSGSTGTSILAARFAIEATGGDVALNEIDQIEDVVVLGLEALDRLGNSDSLEVELASFLAQIARLRGSDPKIQAYGQRAIDAAKRLADDAALLDAALAATGPSAGLPSFGWAGWVGLDLDSQPQRRDVADDCLSQVGPDTSSRPALELRAKRARRSNEAPQGQRLLTVAGQARDLIDSNASAASHELADSLAAQLASQPDSAGHKRLLVDRLRFYAAVDAGDRVALDRSLTGAGSIAVEPNRGRSWTAVDLDCLHLKTAADLVLGRLGSAEQSLEIARSRCRRAGVDTTAFDRQLMFLRLEQGKYDELDELVVRAGRRSRHLWDAGSVMVSALAASGRGDLVATRDLLDQLVSFSAWFEATASGHRPSLLCVAAKAANLTGDRSVAKAALRGLSAVQTSTVSLEGGGIVLGPSSYYAGLAATTLGKRKQARALLQRSTDLARSLGAASWLCRSLTAQASAAAADNAPTAAIDALRIEAADIAATIGAGWLDNHDDR